MWVEFVVGSLPCSKRGFFLGTPVPPPPPPQKPTLPISNATRNQVDEEPPEGCTSKLLFSLFIYLLKVWMMLETQLA